MSYSIPLFNPRPKTDRGNASEIRDLKGEKGCRNESKKSTEPGSKGSTKTWELLGGGEHRSQRTSVSYIGTEKVVKCLFAGCALLLEGGKNTERCKRPDEWEFPEFKCYAYPLS